MEGFDGVFTKRGEADDSCSLTSGVFQEVFVRRGRWRKPCPDAPAESDVTKSDNSAFNVSSEEALKTEARFDVKNTFVNAELMDFDSLQEFLQERKVKSCPASRQVSSVTMLLENMACLEEASTNAETDSVAEVSSGDSGAEDEVLNTASSLGCSPWVDLGENAVLNTASTFMDTRFETHPQGSEAFALDNFRKPAQQVPNQWLVAVNTPDGVVPGVVTLLGSSSHGEMPLPPVAAPVAPAPPAVAPVLRLAEAIAPPELGGPELPSIGSLMHHMGECKPCTFFHTRGCENKENCQFCHLCGPREKKKRLKAQKAARREANFVALENAKAVLATLRASEEIGLQIDTVVE